jgi:tRNA-2-methylthio-N6-dimethylallyladenosine synthase
MAKKVFIRTYGCQMNEYDSARMLDALREGQAMEPTDRPEDADLILLNTCSIREKAQEKVFSELGRYRTLKADKPELLIGVGGCVASQEGHAIADRAPFVDLVFGPQTLHRLPEMIDERRAGATPGAKRQPPLVDISFPEIEKFDRPGRGSGDQSAWAERECLPGPDGRWGRGRPCRAHHPRGGHRRHRSHSLHHQPPRGVL